MLKLTCFGYPTAWKDGNQVTGFISEKALALLIFIAVTHETHSRDYLTGLLWGNTVEQKAKASLRTALYNLGQLLPSMLDVNRKTVGLAPDINLDLDVNVLRHGKNPAVHESDFLAGFFITDAPEFEAWQLHQREQLRLLAIEGWQQQAAEYEQMGHITAAVRALGHLLRLEPWREEAHRDRMRLLTRSGDFEAALHQFKQCAHQLDQELGITPQAATVKLAEQIRGARTQPRDNLPAQSAAFFGREAKLIELETAIQNHQLVTLLGMGGIGKTSLALAFASRQRNAFINGAAFVKLAHITSDTHPAERIAAEIVRTLTTAGMLPISRDPAKMQLFNQLANKEMLLVLDNFEHLLGASQLIDKLMHTAPQVRVLVTSRERLGLKQEQTVWLEGLSLKAAEALFTDTAQRIQPEFVPDSFVPQICQQVGQMPLAIELAAGWIDVHSTAEIFDQLTMGLDSLQGDEANRTERHKSISHLFAQIWLRTSPSNQKLLGELTFFSSSFSKNAAQKGLGASITDLRYLVNRSLLQKDGSSRFRLHPLLHQFLKQQVDVPQESIANLSVYFLNRFAEDGLKTERGAAPDVRVQLQPDYENFAQAWRWAAENRPEQLETIAARLHSLFADQGLDEWVNQLVQFALRQIPAIGFDRLKLRLELEHSYYLFWQGKAFDAAYALLKNCLSRLNRLAIKADYQTEQAYAHTLLGWYFHYHAADLDQANRHFQQAFAGYKVLDNLNYQASRLLDLGNVALDQHRWQDAEAHWQGCAFRAKQVGNELTEACAEFSLGQLAIKQKDWDRAAVKLTLAQPALAHHQGLNVEWHATMGVLATLRGEIDEAQKMFTEQLEICLRYGRVDHTVTAYCNLARVARLQKNQEQANHYFFLAERLSNKKQVKVLANQIEEAKRKTGFSIDDI